MERGETSVHTTGTATVEEETAMYKARASPLLADVGD
jgi:hypothetical protein